MPRPLGPTQASVLASLRNHGYWHVTCGWVWSGPARTQRILDGLVKRGLVVVKEEPWGHHSTRDVYRPVEGRAPEET